MVRGRTGIGQVLFGQPCLTPVEPNTLTREQAIEKATALARAEIDKLDNPE
jgi:hypothetical protein